MKILIIDSHKGTDSTIPQNMHWQNSKILADYLGADLIWSYPNVNDNIKTGYDVIIFVHASHYSYTDYGWLEKNPDARLFYISNEYNLGEPRTLWMAVKSGRKYDVIANHPSEASKIVTKYVNQWYNVNLNSLIYDPIVPPQEHTLFNTERLGCVYYGSFRKDRIMYFKKYLDNNVILSTHQKNIDKFINSGVSSKIISRINWGKSGLFTFKHSLYIEDEKTHKYYNYLANRFYEALNYNCIPIFSKECQRTVDLSGYNIPECYFIGNTSELKNKNDLLLIPEWHIKAAHEKKESLRIIFKIIHKKLDI